MLNKRFKHKKTIALLIFGLAASQALAQYQMKKYSINNGGGKITGGSYEIKSSIGQADASNTLANGNYSLNSGFWHENTDLIFKNGFE